MIRTIAFILALLFVQDVAAQTTPNVRCRDTFVGGRVECRDVKSQRLREVCEPDPKRPGFRRCRPIS